ncbi:MAG: hypothetical protein EB027_04310 [Actinobacteria bacterium]|nr:hypothetical protein [Actinomycetota bacterium]
MDRRPDNDAWFVVAPTRDGFGWAYGNGRTVAPRLKAAWRAPDGCIPSTSRWSHTGFVVFCRTAVAVKFSTYSPGPRTWSRWLEVPLPNAADVTSITAAPLGSQLVLAWTAAVGSPDAGGVVSVALWDPALRRSLKAAAGLWLTTRTATASRATWLSRDALLGDTVISSTSRADSSTVRPIAEVFFDVSSHRVVKRGTRDVWLGALASRTPPAP